ncbi:hypothetical protein ACMHYB_56785 [Sorangium sp. So ce1128]
MRIAPILLDPDLHCNGQAAKLALMVLVAGAAPELSEMEAADAPA